MTETIYRESVVPRGGAWLGVDLNDRFRRHAVVLKVQPNSPAERAGLRSDDLILTVQGAEILSPQHLAEVIGRMQPGTDVEIEVDRNRRIRVVDAILAGRPPLPPPPDFRAQPPVAPDFSDPPPAPPELNDPPPPPPADRQAAPGSRRSGHRLLPSLLPR